MTSRWTTWRLTTFSRAQCSLRCQQIAAISFTSTPLTQKLIFSISQHLVSSCEIVLMLPSLELLTASHACINNHSYTDTKSQPHKLPAGVPSDGAHGGLSGLLDCYRGGRILRRGYLRSFLLYFTLLLHHAFMVTCISVTLYFHRTAFLLTSTLTYLWLSSSIRVGR